MEQENLKSIMITPDENGFIELPYTNVEFNKRCHKVFVDNFMDNVETTYYGIKYHEFVVAGLVVIPVDEETKREVISFDFCPDMSDRPQALAYLLGQRNDFND